MGVPDVPWVTQHPRPFALPVGPVVAGNGVRVALGRRTLVVSSDGKAWKETDIEARELAWGNGVFVAATRNQLLSSSNGSDWKKSYIPLGQLGTEESAGRYVLTCSPDLTGFTLQGHATLSFEKRRELRRRDELAK